MKKVWELPLGTAMLGVGSSAGPPSAIPSASLGASAKQGRLSRKAREGRTPIPSSCRQTTPELYRPLENVATRQTPPDGVEQIGSSVSAVTKVQSIFISSLIRGQI